MGRYCVFRSDTTYRLSKSPNQNLEASSLLFRQNHTNLYFITVTTI